ncbi:MAG TPA: ThuA domain-containing protein [Verrucomicrobiota bacterium]|nr:ThuA domain-containing protein [Verrucomicrobiota bacterium]
MKSLIATLAVVSLALTLNAAPKKLLVVTTTAGFRHSSIPTLEKVLAQLGKDSGSFTVDFVQQPPGRQEKGAPPKLKTDATPEEKAEFEKAETAWKESLKVELQKLSPENLKNYDGVVFASTSGELPIPDPQGLLDWIKEGHAFIGIHAASDTFHRWPEFIEMLGGEFKGHGPQVGVECINKNPKHPANAQLSDTWTITQEEIYEFKNYDAAKVEDLLILDRHPQNKSPGHFPVSWCKPYGKGRVFYTSLGHREDIIDADPELKDRKNSPEISKAFQSHVLGGTEWALGLKPVQPE